MLFMSGTLRAAALARAFRSVGGISTRSVDGIYQCLHDRFHDALCIHLLDSVCILPCPVRKKTEADHRALHCLKVNKLTFHFNGVI